MCSDGKYDCIIPLTKEGPVHDVQWDPTGKGFIVMAGTMPCHSTVSHLWNRIVCEVELAL